MSIEDEVIAKQGSKPGDPRITRKESNAIRKSLNMVPATFHYQDPTPEMQADALWNAIWDEIKTWDINVPTEYVGYSGATGNHVTAIYLAIQDHLQSKLDSLIQQLAIQLPK